MNNSIAVAQPKTHHRERISRNIRYPDFVTGYAARQAGYGFMVGSTAGAGYFVGHGLRYGISYPFWPVVVMSVLIGGCIAGLVGMVSLHTSKQQFSAHMTELEVTDFQTQQALESPQQNLVQWNGEARDKGREGKKVGNVEFSGKNLDDLYLWYEQGVDTIRRDTHGDKPGFADLTDPFNTATFHAAKAAMLEKKLIDKNNRWTAAGVAFIKDE